MGGFEEQEVAVLRTRETLVEVEVSTVTYPTPLQWDPRGRRLS